MASEPTTDELAAAEGYESLLVPALLEVWTGLVLDAADVGLGHRVLDVACGTGILARHALQRVGASGRVTGVDPAPGMLAVAERTEPAVRWRQGTAEALPVEDAAFDAVVCQFGMMFFDDLERAASEMIRALDHGGRFAVAVWDDLPKNPAYAAEVAVLERLAGSAAADAVRIPFGLGGSEERIVDAFQAAGATSVRAETHSGIGRFPSLRTMVEADLYGWLPLVGVDLEEDLNQRILEESERALSAFVDSSGRAVFETSAHIVSGRRAASASETAGTT